MQARPIYYPQEPVSPKYFAGRDKVLSEFEKILKAATSGRAENVAVYGARGIGKTSLLFKVREMTSDSCFTAYYAPPQEMGPKEFVNDILQKMELQYKTELSKYKRFLETIKGLPSKIEEFSLLDVTLALRKDEKSPQIAFMEGILKFKDRGFVSVYMFIDEADLLADEVLAMMRNTLQEVRGPQYSFPTGVVVAGKEDLVQRLTGKLSPIARFFSTHRFELQPLTLEETRDALALPAHELRIKWERNAIDFVYTASRGYPFIVQLYGKYSLDHSSNSLVDLKDVKNAHADVLNEVGLWYEDGWREEPSPKELQVLLALAKLGGSGVYSAIKNRVGTEVATFLRRLVAKGCLLQDESRHRYYFPHPLAGDYLIVKYGSKERKRS